MGIAIAMFAEAIATSPPFRPMSASSPLHYHHSSNHPFHDNVLHPPSLLPLYMPSITLPFHLLDNSIIVNIVNALLLIFLKKNEDLVLRFFLFCGDSVYVVFFIALGWTEEVYHKCGLVLIGVNMATATAPAIVRERLTFYSEEEFSCVIQRH